LSRLLLTIQRCSSSKWWVRGSGYYG